MTVSVHDEEKATLLFLMFKNTGVEGTPKSWVTTKGRILYAGSQEHKCVVCSVQSNRVLIAL